jgi:type IV secretory pathway VirB2 component (pilin)
MTPHGYAARRIDGFYATNPAKKALDKKLSSRQSRGMTCSIEANFTATEVHAMNLSPAWRSHFRAFKDSKAIFLLLLLVPAAAHAQAAGGSPFDTGFSAMQNLFTGTVAKVASLIAIVVGGYQFAHGEPGAKKTLAGVAAGTGIAVLASNVLTWLWGI